MSKKIPQTEEEWKEKLSDEQYAVMRKKGTEPAFSGNLIEKGTGDVYVCSACNNPLFETDAKFDSGSGWPSFDKAITGSVRFEKDDSMGMERTEVVCAQCGSHLGHVFDDPPISDDEVQGRTGKRYCINAVCLE